jgi:dihydroorotate dehydrogenase (NAD+) catalytic subunit
MVAADRGPIGVAARLAGPVDVGSVRLRNGVMTASGTAGYGTELARYLDLGALGAFVTKSLAAFEWAGNPPPRLHPTPAGMLNAVGLQGPGIPAWRRDTLPALIATGASVVVSIWGRSVDEFAAAARLLRDAPARVVAVEVNLSCPNLDGGAHVFAHDGSLAAAVVAEVAAAAGRPCWAKLSANTDRLGRVAEAVAEAGADAVTCINTVLGLAFDETTGTPALGAGGGGLSGPAIHPVAVRAVHDVRAACPDLPIVGVGGVRRAWDAAELLLAGAAAVQVGTATFADPRAAANLLAEVGES